MNAVHFSQFYSLRMPSERAHLLEGQDMPPIQWATITTRPDRVFAYCLPGKDKDTFERVLEDKDIQYMAFDAEGVDGFEKTVRQRQNALDAWMNSFLPAGSATKDLWI